MPDYNALEALPSDFHAAARPEVPVIQPPKVMASIALDEDVLAYLQNDSPSNWHQSANDVLRHYMETNMRCEADFQAAIAAAGSWETEP